MRYRFALLAVTTLCVGCHRGPTPPGGTYEITVDGDKSIWSAAETLFESSDYALDSTASVYINESASGGDIEDVFYQVGATPPRTGPLFELRLFTGAFDGETSTTTLAGSFDGDTLYGSGTAATGGLNFSVQLAGQEEYTQCAVYERLRVVEIDGVWVDGVWDINLGATYAEYCANSEGVVTHDGYPRTTYDLSGQMNALYDPFTEGETQSAQGEVQ